MRAAISGARTISYLSGCTRVTADVGVVVDKRWVERCRGVRQGERLTSSVFILNNIH